MIVLGVMHWSSWFERRSSIASRYHGAVELVCPFPSTDEAPCYCRVTSQYRHWKQPNPRLLFEVNTSLKSDRHMGYQDVNGDVTFAG